MNDDLLILSEKTASLLHAKAQVLTTAESCTAGWVAQTITQVAGSSAFFERGFVTYSNAAKHEMLGVSNELLSTYGAVSEEVAIAMAEGALKNSHATVSVSVTGIAGPQGGTPEKPVGTVWFGFSSNNQTSKALRQVFSGDRCLVRKQSVIFALQTLISFIS